LSDAWNDAVGDWSTDSDAWNGFLEALVLTVSTALSLSVQAEVIPAIIFGANAGQTFVAEVETNQSVSFAVSKGFTIAPTADPAPSILLGVAIELINSPIAEAYPQDVVDDWSVADGAWNDGGGGIWNQPSGTLLLVRTELFPTAGLDQLVEASFALVAEMNSTPEAVADTTITLTTNGGLTEANVIDALGSVSLESQLNSLVTVEAIAQPSDRDDWDQSGNWDDSGGGIWDQPGELHLNVFAQSLAGSGIEQIEALEFVTAVSFTPTVVADVAPTLQISAIVSQENDPQADIEASVLLIVSEDFNVLENIALSGEIELEAMSEINVSGGSDVELGIDFHLILDTRAISERPVVWIEYEENDSDWFESLESSFVWMGAPFQFDSWLEEEIEISFWLLSSEIDSDWTELSGRVSLWQSQDSIDKEWL